MGNNESSNKDTMEKLRQAQARAGGNQQYPGLQAPQHLYGNEAVTNFSGYEGSH